jgi:hypothetical protein
VAEQLWVGRLEEQSLVYDPSIQLPECPHVFLWNPATNEMEKYLAAGVRKHIKPHDRPQDVVAHIASYNAWKAIHSAAWLDEEKQYYEDRRLGEALDEEARVAARVTLEERHRLQLEKFGKAYYGLRAATGERRRRETHCYACKDALDNTIQVECVSCGWILCNCGACGCTYLA